MVGRKRHEYVTRTGSVAGVEYERDNLLPATKPYGAPASIDYGLSLLLGRATFGARIALIRWP